MLNCILKVYQSEIHQCVSFFNCSFSKHIEYNDLRNSMYYYSSNELCSHPFHFACRYNICSQAYLNPLKTSSILYRFVPGNIAYCYFYYFQEFSAALEAMIVPKDLLVMRFTQECTYFMYHLQISSCILYYVISSMFMNFA